MSDNEMIAEFMGIRVSMRGPVLYLSDEDGYVDFTGDAEPYWPDRCWNNLMPVVVKIEGILSTPGASVTVGWDHWNDQFDGTINTDIEVTYQIVIEFIKWYNLTPKP